jgi:hypothetical protein
MALTVTLDIPGHRDEPVPNTFNRQEGGTAHLAILFPGYGYRVTMPLLHYSERVLLAHGADVLRVEYAYDRDPTFRDLAEAERNRWFEADVEAACRVGLAQRAYSRVTLVGKSIGTLAMGHLIQANARLAGAECVWLTPLLGSPQLRAQIEQVKPRSLFVIGTADRNYNAALLAEVKRATGGDSLVVEGANHSLEIEGDVLRSVRALEQMVVALERFLSFPQRR